MQRQRQLPVHCHFVHRRALGGINHVLWNPLFQRFFNHRRVVGVEEHLALPLVEVGFALGAGGLFNAVGVVQQHAEVADTSHAGF